MGNFLLGFGIGLAAGVLFAPKPGSETRNYLTSKASETSDYLSRQAQELKDSASDAVKRGKQAVMNQKERLAGTMQSSAPQEVYQR